MPFAGPVTVTMLETDDAQVLQVAPEDGSPTFSIRFYPPEMTACDGTLEQRAAVGLLLADAARRHGVRMAILTDSGQGATFEAGTPGR